MVDGGAVFNCDGTGWKPLENGDLMVIQLENWWFNDDLTGNVWFNGWWFTQEEPNDSNSPRNKGESKVYGISPIEIAIYCDFIGLNVPIENMILLWLHKTDVKF